MFSTATAFLSKLLWSSAQQNLSAVANRSHVPIYQDETFSTNCAYIDLSFAVWRATAIRKGILTEHPLRATLHYAMLCYVFLCEG